MISYIKGKIEHTMNNYIIIENNNIGYKIFMSEGSIINIPKVDKVKIYTYMNVREDDISLYGFLSLEEINIFNLLITVSGIGPKVAVGILNCLSPIEIKTAIVTEDLNTLCKAPGVGKKTSQRLVLELKDKIKLEDVINISGTQSEFLERSKEKSDATDALIALGYNKSESMKAVMEVALENMKTEEIVKKALGRLFNS